MNSMVIIEMNTKKDDCTTLYNFERVKHNYRSKNKLIKY